MSKKRFFQTGGIITMLFCIFHLFFWNLFDWPHSLASLTADNRAVMQVLNIHTAYVLLVFAIISLAFSETLGSTKLGRALAMAMALFWGLRTVNEAIFWDVASVPSWLFMGVFLLVGMLYFIPFAMDEKENQVRQ